MSIVFHIEAGSESNAYRGFADPRDALSAVSVSAEIDDAAPAAAATARRRIVAGRFWLLWLEPGRSGWRTVGALIPAQREFRSLLESEIGVVPASLAGWLQSKRLAEGRPVISEVEQCAAGAVALVSHEAALPDRRRAGVLVLLDAAVEPRAADFTVMRVECDGTGGLPLQVEIAHGVDGTRFVTAVLCNAPLPAGSPPDTSAPEMCRRTLGADLPADGVLVAERREEERRTCLASPSAPPRVVARGLRCLGIGRTTMAEPPGPMRVGHGRPVLALLPGAPAAADWHTALPGIPFAGFEAWAGNRANLCRMTGFRGSVLLRVLQRLRAACAALEDGTTMALLDALPDPAVGGLLISLVPAGDMPKQDGAVDWRGAQPMFRALAPYRDPQVARLAELAMQALAPGAGDGGTAPFPAGRALIRTIHAAARLTLRARITPKPLLTERPCGAILAGVPAGGTARLHVRPLVADSWFDDTPAISPAVRRAACGAWSDDGTGYAVFDGAAMTLAVAAR